MKKPYFSRGEIGLWLGSTCLIVCSFLIFDRQNFLTLAASLVGVTSLIFNAKGNPIGQLLMIVFSILYGIISFSFSYYGEMLTYLGMTMPMAVIALISWLKHPFGGKRSEVAVNRLSRQEIFFMFLISVPVTALFGILLAYWNTANLFFSTLSVTTSFVAVTLTFRRSPWFGAAYAANDAVLLVLWISASVTDRSYLSVVACFAAFLVNDVYGFLCWKKRRTQQECGAAENSDEAVASLR